MSGNSNGGWKALTEKIMVALPPPFLLLCLLNVGFLYVVLQFVANETAQRVSLVTKMLDVCEQQDRHTP